MIMTLMLNTNNGVIPMLVHSLRHSLHRGLGEGIGVGEHYDN